jgi:hypothetical protein
MKVTGPDAGSTAPLEPTPGSAEAAPATADTDRSGRAVGVSAGAGADAIEGSGKLFAEKLGGVTGPAGPDPAAAASREAPIVSPDIATDLVGGRLDPQSAVNKVVEQVLTRQLGPDAPAAVREQVRAALQDALENDPLLADKLRRLGA